MFIEALERPDADGDSPYAQTAVVITAVGDVTETASGSRPARPGVIVVVRPIVVVVVVVAVVVAVGLSSLQTALLSLLLSSLFGGVQMTPECRYCRRSARYVHRRLNIDNTVCLH